jgi:archaellin
MTIAKAMAAIAAKIHGREAGVAGIGTVFVLMALVAGGATFGYAASHQNALAALRFNAVAEQALDNAGRAVMPQGAVYVQDTTGDGVIDGGDAISLDIAVAPGGTPVGLATLAAFITTSDSRLAVHPAFATITGDDDGVLQNGEIVEMTFAPPAQMGPSERFTIELIPAGGATSDISVTMPAAIDGLMTLR